MRRRDSGGSLEGDGEHTAGTAGSVEKAAKAATAELGAELSMNEEPLANFEEELRDFLAADLLDVPVDPAFKEQLRRELWEIVERNAEKWRDAHQSSVEDEELGGG